MGSVKKKGLFVSFEGVDGSGKSAQAEKLHRNLVHQNYPALLIREPGGTDISEKIRQLLLDRKNSGLVPIAELYLYEAARAQLVHDRIIPELRKNRIVIADRFTDSTMAYQAYGRGLAIRVIEQANRMACDGIVPDKTFFLDIPLSEAQKRMAGSGKNDRMEKECESFFERVRRGYRKLARQEPERFIMLNGLKSRGDLEMEILNVVLVQIQNAKIKTGKANHEKI
jgi:dTMP kinase